MIRRLAGGALILVALAGGWWIAVGRKPAAPAIVTPAMNAHTEVSNDVDARIARMIHERPPSERPPGTKLVALTFDDGPFPVETPLLLDVLADLRVPATFFVIGRDARQYPELTARIAREGHEVANHTFTHPNLDRLSAPMLQQELRDTAATVYPLTHDAAVREYMRPPHGRITEAGIRASQAAGFSVVFWNEDPADERVSNVQALAERIDAEATQPDIILLHSGTMDTIQALPSVVEHFKRAGYRFVTVGELLASLPVNVIQHPVRQAI
jgi:peptidoglycan/xylan/chitin deacetylase (PgdA/CDA1 family)